MFRRIFLTCFAAPLVLVLLIADSPTSTAQGLLRRIQSRIQARSQPARQPRPPAAPTATSPSRTAGQGSDSSLSRVKPVGEDGDQDKEADLDDENELGKSILSRPGAEDASDNDNSDKAQYQSNQRATIGINVAEPRGGAAGVEVTRFNPESKADEAGLRVGDVIIAVNGKPVRTSRDIARQLSELSGGQKIQLQIFRDGKPFAISVPLVGGKTNTNQQDRLANTPKKAAPMATANASDRVADSGDPTQIPLGVTTDTARGVRGAMVTAVSPGSPAAQAGLKNGDRIVSIDGRMVINSDSLERSIATRPLGDEVALQWVRDSKLVAADVSFVKLDPAAVAARGSNGDSATAPSSDPSDSEPSVGSAFGSILGGFFGSSTEPKTENTDEMAFGDDEPIQPVGFESATDDASGVKEAGQE